MELLYFLVGALAFGVLFALYRQTTVIDQARKALSQEQEQTKRLKADLQQRDKTIEGMRQEMAKADALILKLREQLAQSDTQVRHYELRYNEQERTIAQYREQIESTERDSAQSKALFSTVSNVAYDYVFVLDEHHAVIAVNSSTNDLFGDRNPVGEKIGDVLDAPELEDIVQRALEEEESLEEQFVMDFRYYRARTQVMRYNGQHVFIGIAMQDITQLVQLNRARRDMVANISHELRTPIQKIRLIIDGLFHQQTRPKRKASIASLHAIAQETESLQWVVQELLDLSMIESGQAIMKLIDEPLVEIVGEAVERLSEKLEQKQLTVVQHIPQKMRVLCDREHIRRVLINLISNAIKWSPNDESITISATRDNEEVRVSVFDNGPGVPDDQRERIFERFYQVDPARTGKDGSGLGLAICKHIVEAHGGKIWAEGNSQGGGGRFLFTLLDTSDESDKNEFMDRGQHDVIFRPQHQQEASDDEDDDDDDFFQEDGEKLEEDTTT